MSGEEVFQAVLLADSFGRDLLHLAAPTPPALLPLVGTPLLDYALETLALSGVHETFLFCSSRPDLVKEHIRNAQDEKAAWSTRMTVNVVVSETCRSPGDALRDLDAKGLIRGYFILLGADTISNVQLLPLLEKHKEICKRDKNAAMMLVYKEAVPGHRAQCADDNIMLVCNAADKRVLQYQKLRKNDRKVLFPVEMFLGHSEVKILCDVIDANIFMCSPSVLPLFADNFDFQTVEDFIKGILMNEELLASTIYCHRLSGDEYASRVTNLKMYQTISQDIMHRWVFPLVPDMGITKQKQIYTLLRNCVYRHKKVTLAKDCELEEDVVVSEESSIGEDTRIARSVIGKRCTIGSKCVIEDSFIMDGCTIGDNCSIKTSILCTDCSLKTNVDIDNVISKKGVVLDANTLLKKSYIHDSPSGTSYVKLGEKAYVAIIEDNCDNESISSDNSEGGVKGTPSNALSNKWWEEKSTDGYSSSSDEDASSIAESIQEDENLFLQEVIDSLVRGFDEKLKCDNLILEINSSRYAYNMSLQEVNLNVVRAIFSLSPMNTTVKEIVPTFKKLFSYFKPIIKNYIKDPPAMKDCLKAIEDICNDNEAVKKSIGQILVVFYDQDILSEDIITKWYEDLVDESVLSKNTSLTQFINWLEQASEESDES